jgi:uncharacterized membrane protein YfcA
VYQRQQKVDFRTGIKWGIVGIAAGLVAAAIALVVLPANTKFLRGGVSYLAMLVGAGFFLRGRKALQKAKMKQVPTHPQNIVGEMVEAETVAVPPPEPLPKKIFSPRAQVGIMVVGVIISGAMAGLLGIGSGTNFALLFIFILGYDTLRATGTACFVMALLMGAIGLVFVWFANLVPLLPYLLVAVGFSAIGTIIGSHFALRLSEIKLNFMVGTVVIIAAVVATVQSFLI